MKDGLRGRQAEQMGASLPIMRTSSPDDAGIWSPAPGPLTGLRIVESTAFIAAPLATMSLGQLGAEIIRLDAPTGGLDYRRWPLAESGASLYWTCLNRGKRSVTLDLRNRQDRERAADLICAPGEGNGIFVTNLPLKDVLTFDALRERREDVIVVTLDGSPDGTTAIDYTVNAASGVAMMTGPGGVSGPINNAMPFWDVICGKTLALGLLAAERERRMTGRGQLIALSLSDVAMASVANVGILAEAELTGHSRARDGNWIYGTFGSDFPTADERRIMLVAVTDKQWNALVDAMGLAQPMADLARAFEADLSREEERYRIRAAIAALIASWTERRTLEQIRQTFTGTPVCWSPFNDVTQLLEQDWRASEKNDLFTRIPHPGVGPILTPDTPLRFSGHVRNGARSAPVLGADTASVLGDPAAARQPGAKA